MDCWKNIVIKSGKCQFTELQGDYEKVEFKIWNKMKIPLRDAGV